MKKLSRILVMGLIAISTFQTPVYAESDPYPGVATGGEIPGTRVSSAPNQSQSDWEATEAYKNRPACGAGAGNGVEVNATTHVYSIYCVKTWRPSAEVDADAAFRASQSAAIAVATAESQAWNAANPGKQKCVQWGPIVHANGVSTASGGVCANPVEPGPGTTVPTQSTDSVVGPSSAPTTSNSSSPAVIPTNETSITGNGSPFTKIIAGQLSSSECPAGFQAANGIIVAIGTGTFTECWPDLAWKANRLGGTYWEQFKASGGTYDVTNVLNALAVIAEYKLRAKEVAQAAANLTPGVQRCSTWSVYGQSGEECAYAFIQPNGSLPSSDSKTATSGSDSATAISTPNIDTSTALLVNTNNLDTSTATVTLVPVPATATTGTSASDTSVEATPTVSVGTGKSADTGQVVEVAADLSAKQFKGKVVLIVNANVEAQPLTITATKKGGKTVEIPLVTNSEGDRTLSSKLNLVGYTLTLKNGDQVLDRFILKK